MRTGGRFRVVLNAESHQFRIGKSLRSPVVEVLVSRLTTPGDRSGNDDKSVILRGDFNLPCLFLPDRLVDAVMTEFQSESFTSAGYSKYLVPKANSHYRDFAQEFP